MMTWLLPIRRATDSARHSLLYSSISVRTRSVLPSSVRLLAEIPEPYATMGYVAVFTGLRVSELIALKWEDVLTDSITIDERCCRGDWVALKSEASNATIGVNLCVIERIHRLKLLTVQMKAGSAVRQYKVVKSDGPHDLVFQSVKAGRPMRDNNILSRFIKPAGRKLGLDFVNWRCLRTSHATWLKMAGADVKDEGRSCSDTALASEHDARYLSAIRA